MRRQRNRGNGRARIWLILLLVLVLGAGFFVVRHLEQKDDELRTGELTDAPVEQLILEQDGKRYLYRDELTTYLIMGTDETTETAKQLDGENLNNRQADFIMLMIVDPRDKSYTALHINRDTYMDIQRLDENGNPDGTVLAHLNNAHSFGSGGKDSCRNVAEAVSRLLCGVPVDHYMAVTMDGIPVLADLVGGVPVTIEEDMTSVNPAYAAGSTVTLKGQDALAFVRARSSVSDGTNLSRMTRQRSFIVSFYERVQARMSQDSGFALRFADTLSPYLTSNMTTEKLAALAEELQGYRFAAIEDLPGTAKVNSETGYMDFLVDEAALKPKVIRLFFRVW